MMKFREIKSSIISILDAASSGRFVVIGAQNQTTGASELLKKYVRVFYRSGDFPKTQSTPYSRPIKHNMQFDVELMVSARANCNIDDLSDPELSESQRAALLTSSNNASIMADNGIDELFDNVFQIIMSPDNYDIGFEKYGISDRWVSTYRKDDPLPQGENAVITGMLQITCSFDENIDSEIGSPAIIQDATINDIAGVSGNIGGN